MTVSLTVVDLWYTHGHLWRMLSLPSLFCNQYMDLDIKMYEVAGLKNLSPQIIRIYLNHQNSTFIFVKK